MLRSSEVRWTAAVRRTGDVVLKPFPIRVVIADVPPEVSEERSSERSTMPLQCQHSKRKTGVLCSIMVPLGWRQLAFNPDRVPDGSHRTCPVSAQQSERLTLKSLSISSALPSDSLDRSIARRSKHMERIGATAGFGEVPHCKLSAPHLCLLTAFQPDTLRVHAGVEEILPVLVSHGPTGRHRQLAKWRRNASLRRRSYTTPTGGFRAPAAR